MYIVYFTVDILIIFNKSVLRRHKNQLTCKLILFIWLNKKTNSAVTLRKTSSNKYNFSNWTIFTFIKKESFHDLMYIPGIK